MLSFKICFYLHVIVLFKKNTSSEDVKDLCLLDKKPFQTFHQLMKLTDIKTVLLVVLVTTPF